MNLATAGDRRFASMAEGKVPVNDLPAAAPQDLPELASGAVGWPGISRERRRNSGWPLLVCVIAALFALVPHLDATERASGPIYDGPELDYQPAIIRRAQGDLMVVIERLAAFSGDLYVTFSTDQGSTWSPLQAAIASSLNERHPALVQVDPTQHLLFYLVDEGSSAYRIHRASSPDGSSWTDDGAIDLGWTGDGDINPSVIIESDGTLTMTYQRLNTGRAHIAQSTDLGLTWDTLRTAVTTGDGRLPRVVKREIDGAYLVSYQSDPGNHDVDVYAKVSYDPHDWSAAAAEVSTDINSHDSQAVVLASGAFALFYAKTPVNYFDIHYRVSCDGVKWETEVQVTDDPDHYDTQPHPLLSNVPGEVVLVWSHQDGATPYDDHDVWVDNALPVTDPCPPLPINPLLVAPVLLAATSVLLSRERRRRG